MDKINLNEIDNKNKLQCLIGLSCVRNDPIITNLYGRTIVFRLHNLVAIIRCHV